MSAGVAIGETMMLTSAQKHRLASGLAHVLHAGERAEYIRAELSRGDVFAAAEDCRLLIDALCNAKQHLSRLELEINPDDRNAMD